MRLRRWARWVSIALAILTLLLGVTIAIVRHLYSGRNLGDVVEKGVNLGKDEEFPIRGRVEVDSVDWDLGDIIDLKNFPIRIDHAQVFDPWEKKVMELWGIRGQVDAWNFIPPFGSGDIDSETMIVDKGWCLVEEIVVTEEDHQVGLVSAFQQKHKPPPGAKFEPGPIFQLKHLELKAIDLLLHFQSWQADLYNLHTDNGTLRVSFREKRVQDLDFTFSTLPVLADSAKLTIGPLGFDLKNVRAERFGIFTETHTQMDYDLTAETAEGARLHAKGALLNLWAPPGGVDLTLELENAGALVHRLSEGVVSGANVTVNGRVTGTYENPTVRLAAKNVELNAVPGLPMTVRAFAGEMHPALHEATVHEATVAALGGEIRASGKIHLDTMRFQAEVQTLAPIDLVKQLRPDVLKFARGGLLSGSLSVEGTPDDITIIPKDVRLGKARISRGQVAVKGSEVIYDVRIVIEADKKKGSSIDLKGKYNIKTKELDANVSVDIDPLGPWLETIQAAPILDWFAGRAKVTGTYNTKSGKVQAKASRVALLDTVNVAAIFKNGVLAISKLTATPLAGKLTGSGRVRIEPTVRLDKVKIEATGLKLAKAQPLAGAIDGTARLRINAEGTPGRKWQADIAADVAGLSVGTFGLGDAKAQIEVDEAGAAIKELHIGRPPAGTLDVVGTIGFNQSLDLTVDLRRYPLGTLPGISSRPELGLSGEASLRARITGDIQKPRVTGVAQAIQVAFRQTILGAASVRLEPWPDGRIHFAGRLFQNKLSVDGFVRLKGAFEVSANVRFRRLEVDEVLPELSRSIGAHGHATGVGTVKLGATVSASLSISELVFSVEGHDENGRPRPLYVKNVDKVEIEYAGGVARLKRPVLFEGPDGNFRLEGLVGEKHMDVVVAGEVRLSLLAFYTRRWVEEATGNALVNVRLSGPPQKPVMQGTVSLKDAAVRRPRQETFIKLPTGRIVLANDRIVVENLILEVERPEYRTVMSGELTLKNFVPDRVTASIKGRLAARLVEVLFPQHVSASKGAARIDLSIGGAARDPDIDGTLTFDQVFEVAPRGFRRDVALTRGKVRFTNKEILFKDVSGTVDEVSENLYLRGNPQACTSDGFCTAVRLYQWSLIDLYVEVNLSRFTHRVPGVLEVEVNLHDLTLSGDLNGLQLRGAVDIVDGRYSQGFRLDEFLRPVRVAERAEPFWQDDPLLRSTLLYLQVSSNQGAFRIDNNVANVPLSGDVTITGTPQKPQFNGRIAMDGGTIKLPLTRPRFQLQSGSVTFFAGRDMPAETPEIDLLAEDPTYEDLAGTTHTITLDIKGPLSKLRAGLSTSTGLNQAQTLQLITLRRSDLDEFARGRAQQNVSLEDRQLGQTALSSQDTFTSAADPLIKEAFSQYISILVEDPLRRALRLDCFRVVAGLESTGVYACKDLVQNFRLEGEAEIGLRGGDREQVGAKFQITDEISIGALGQRVNPLDEREETENNVRSQLRWRFLIP